MKQKIPVPLRGKMFQIRSVLAFGLPVLSFRPLTGQNVSNLAIEQDAPFLILFPSPYGAKCFKYAGGQGIRGLSAVSVPLRGKMFQMLCKMYKYEAEFRGVSVPLRGKMFQIPPHNARNVIELPEFPSPYGAKCFKFIGFKVKQYIIFWFPSPYGAKCFKYEYEVIPD